MTLRTFFSKSSTFSGFCGVVGTLVPATIVGFARFSA